MVDGLNHAMDTGSHTSRAPAQLRARRRQLCALFQQYAPRAHQALSRDGNLPSEFECDAESVGNLDHDVTQERRTPAAQIGAGVETH
jgi:hypothetical protein